MANSKSSSCMLRKKMLFLAGIAFVGFASGCATPAAPPPLHPHDEYRVGAPDSLLVTILPDPVIEREVTVRPDGKITLDLIGDVQASDRTTDQIAASIRQKIGRYKRDAAVTVTVNAAVSETITLFGEVRNAGVFPLQHETRVAEAVAAFGGTTIYASKRYIRVIRAEGDSAHVIRVNLRAIQGGDLTTNIQLQAGDIVVVPPSALARIGYFFQQILFPFQPVISAAGSVSNLTTLAP